MSHRAAADDALFWERLHGMPDSEAEIELVMRRHALIDEIAALNAFRNGCYTREADEAGVRIGAHQAQLTRIGDELKLVRNRMDRANWRRAVRAVFGEEGYLLCVHWIMDNCIEPGRTTK
jgi:uncharacterized protein YmfQ (DUF2313 family)